MKDIKQTINIMKMTVWKFLQNGIKKEPGIDGILVTVGLCIIALLLCVFMKESLEKFIESIVTTLTREANNILTGAQG